MENLIQHHAHNDDRDKELKDEDIALSLLGVAGYAAQSLKMGMAPHKIAKYLKSEQDRLFLKLEGEV